MELKDTFADKVIDPVCAGPSGFAMTTIIREPENTAELGM